jgi:hypothetical protein
MTYFVASSEEPPVEKCVVSLLQVLTIERPVPRARFAKVADGGRCSWDGFHYRHGFLPKGLVDFFWEG